MIFPIGDDNIKGGAKPVFTYFFLLSNILIYIYEVSLGGNYLQVFFNTFGTVPKDFLNGHKLYSVFTNMFLHGGMAHLVGNMLFLWIFGDNIEAVFGNIKFFLFYIAGGVIASLVHIGMNYQSTIPSLGASGAISAVLGAYLILFPRSRIKMIFIIFFMTFYIPALFFIGFWFFQQFLSVYNEAGQMPAQTQGVAWWAHIGGFIFGVIVGFFFRTKAKTYEFVREYNNRFNHSKYR
ncbi:rhomboid family intramembrane serine protease [Membranihabitans maritimus]|uniref:rhomboid family intramembrane serine protease n=1 Tax=Membranihabitans maritimus TaxID=2904244 RepID=UPI001F45B902|nr:rhomboid family intramembrane serine protease [Membranihabitans maritimus]